ncbi:MAG: hypothetical protein QOK06_2797, partial [Acidimicrobiaceae bacterium]
KDARFGMPCHSLIRIKIKWLVQEVGIARDVCGMRWGTARREQYHQSSERDRAEFHLDTTPANPPEISDATFVRILGSTRPPGDARYLGSHFGSNFSLYCLSP